MSETNGASTEETGRIVKVDRRGNISLKIGALAGVVGLLTGIGGAWGSWAVIPYRLQQVESTQDQLRRKHEDQQMLLLRIDERVQMIYEELGRGDSRRRLKE